MTTTFPSPILGNFYILRVDHRQGPDDSAQDRNRVLERILGGYDYEVIPSRSVEVTMSLTILCAKIDHRKDVVVTTAWLSLVRTTSPTASP